MKKLLKLAALALVVLAAALVLRTLLVRSRQITAPPAAKIKVDATAAATRLAGALRFETISREGTGPVDPAPFLALHHYLEESFPRVHATLGREVVAGYSLLYTWKGRDPSLPPLLLTAHLDVVPVEPGSERSW